MSNNQAIKPYDKVRAVMKSEQSIQAFSEILGSDNIAKQYVSSVMIAVWNDENLQKCTPASIYTCALRAATLKLSCDPAYGQAWLVPFKNKCTFITGYKGYRQMALRTGQYKHLHDGAIYEGQTIEQNQLTGETKIVGFPTSRTPIGYFVHFELKNGFTKTYYMTVEEIREHGKKYSKSYNYSSSPWQSNFEDMAKKTIIILGLSKYGYFDDNDTLALSVTDEDDFVDAEWQEEVIKEAGEPVKMSNDQIMSDLGYDVEMTTGEIIEDKQEENQKGKTRKQAQSMKDIDIDGEQGTLI